MSGDVVDLRDFYDSRLGQVARRLIRGRIRAVWPDVRGMRVLGLGYATPFLRAFGTEAERLIAVMPASQGVIPWPPEGPGLVALADELELPLADRSIDRVLIVHCLESTEQVRGLMRELWRVMADGGRLLAVVPNRSGIWARLERTPFGQGQPYSRDQINRLLRDTMFMPLGSTHALFVPPVSSRLVLRSAAAWENLGQRWFPRFSGVVMVEAAKQLYAASPTRERVAEGRGYMVLPQGFRRSG